MKNTGNCPKCNSSEVYTNKNLSKSGERCVIYAASKAKLFLDTYVCLECGYFEEYVDDESLNNTKKTDFIRSEWKKKG